ncbi:SufD family Fe-S cluster assembly protein [Candidatus Gottesmanbacteria bacterium]|nr:SufD family Fe-S cluster assembly protein [Candidatus Gottesmanbacteria bacterium]
MKTIAKDTTIVKAVTRGTFREDFAVGKNAHLIVVYVVAAKGKMELYPSVHLTGAGATATLIGLVTGTGSAEVKMSTLQHHKAPNTTSNLLVKSILSDNSSFAYDGSITVDKKAQKTDAYQRNENMLLDTETQAISSPALEILANDVRCTHGATVKTIDENELWYLASRGIDPESARAMIASGFLRSAFSLIQDDDTRSRVETMVSELEKGK